MCRPFIDFSETLHADQIDFYCDAALNNERLGIVGRFGKFWFAAQQKRDQVLDPHGLLNIQVAELYSIFLALFLWIEKLSNRRVVIFTDNESVMHMLNRSSSSCRVCMKMIRLITLWSMTHNTRVFGMHVGTKQNTRADLLSRGNVAGFLALQRKYNLAETRNTLPRQFWPIPNDWFI